MGKKRKKAPSITERLKAGETAEVNFWVADGVAERIGPDDEPTA